MRKKKELSIKEISDLFLYGNKLVGYLHGTPIYSNPLCPEGMIYCLPNYEFMDIKKKDIRGNHKVTVSAKKLYKSDKI